MMRRVFATLSLLPPLACSGGSAGSAPQLEIPLGSYSDCTGSASLRGGTAVVSGWGSLLLEQNGRVLKATFGGVRLLASGTVFFEEATPTAAVASDGQSLSVDSTLGGTVKIGTGALVYAGRTLFLSTQGGLDGASYFLTCNTASAAPPQEPPTSPPSLPAGVFGSCSFSSRMATGGHGAVALAEANGVVTATLSGLAFTTSSAGASDAVLAFAATSNTTAQLQEGQIVSVDSFSCTEPGLSGLTPLRGIAGAMVMQGDALFIDLVGATSCAEHFPVSIACTRGGS